MSISSVHIVSFSIPYPANYGGVIDVFYKIKGLSEKGVRVHLHCFQYGRPQAEELEKYCCKVDYYPRKTGLLSQLSLRPYIVKSRQSERLIQNLLQDDYPIMFEGMHTMGIALDKRLKNRRKIYRAANIEHHYYHYLAKAENNLLKKLYYYLEASRLKRFQQFVKQFDAVMAVSEADRGYLSKHFPNIPTYFIPCFHQNNSVECLPGRGEYALYNGNLSVAENIKAVEYLIDHVFSKIDYPLIVAGLNPPKSLVDKASKHDNIELKANVSEQEMEALIKNAQFNTLITFQATGLKLKLLNTLFRGRFCVVNSKMLSGTGLDDLCLQAETPEEMIRSIEAYKDTDFTSSDIQKRKQGLYQVYDNGLLSDQTLSVING